MKGSNDVPATSERRPATGRRPRGGLCIAIDGPSGAGKSTLARRLARHLDLAYVDTGAMYRALAWRDLQLGEGPGGIVSRLSKTRLDVVAEPDGFRIIVDGQDVSDEIREPRIGERASKIAALAIVRSWLLPRQRGLATAGAVVEGRDIGTVVLPDADFKFFITASQDVRLRRRAHQLGTPKTTAESDVRDRDQRDLQRRTSPLRPAAGAVLIDTSAEEIESSLQRLLQVIEGCRKGRGDRGGGASGAGDGRVDSTVKPP